MKKLASLRRSKRKSMETASAPTEASLSTEKAGREEETREAVHEEAKFEQTHKEPEPSGEEATERGAPSSDDLKHHGSEAEEREEAKPFIIPEGIATHGKEEGESVRSLRGDEFEQGEGEEGGGETEREKEVEEGARKEQGIPTISKPSEPKSMEEVEKTRPVMEGLTKPTLTCAWAEDMTIGSGFHSTCFRKAMKIPFVFKSQATGFGKEETTRHKLKLTWVRDQEDVYKALSVSFGSGVEAFRHLAGGNDNDESKAEFIRKLSNMDDGSKIFAVLECIVELQERYYDPRWFRLSPIALEDMKLPSKFFGSYGDYFVEGFMARSLLRAIFKKDAISAIGESDIYVEGLNFDDLKGQLRGIFEDEELESCVDLHIEGVKDFSLGRQGGLQRVEECLSRFQDEKCLEPVKQVAFLRHYLSLYGVHSVKVPDHHHADLVEACKYRSLLTLNRLIGSVKTKVKLEGLLADLDQMPPEVDRYTNFYRDWKQRLESLEEEATMWIKRDDLMRSYMVQLSERAADFGVPQRISGDIDEPSLYSCCPCPVSFEGHDEQDFGALSEVSEVQVHHSGPVTEPIRISKEGHFVIGFQISSALLVPEYLRKSSEPSWTLLDADTEEVSLRLKTNMMACKWAATVWFAPKKVYELKQDYYQRCSL
ncbi:hypothetical protein IE53DRAFT_359937 [Violaceomyces palustris]|uniref:Uncharacterized protein n=1 Tax=Violaceomyces palustris TaxID=1673888 RepID=A0ACD0P5X0_9BASI|nr:hypothetical protein IE53DRAFT_359937 [Violaceomyces palustris]